MKALRTYLVNQMPARIFPLGKVPSYSNYSFAKLPGHGIWFRTHAILLALGGIAFALFCWQYHLLGTSLKF